MGSLGHRGVTLLELLVVIVLLGGIASVSGFALAGWRGDRTPDDPIALGRRRAIMTGQTIHFSIIRAQDSVPRSVLIRPDGRVLRDPVAR